MKELQFPLIVLLIVMLSTVVGCFYLGIIVLFRLDEMVPTSKDPLDGAILIFLGLIGSIMLGKLLPIVRKAFGKQ